MKQIELVNAYKALSHLAVQTLPIKTAYAIHNLRRALSSAWEFQLAQEQTLLEKYHPTVEGNVLRFGDANNPEAVKRANAYARDLQELNNMEVDYDAHQVVRILLTDSVALTANEIDALDGFAEFYEEGEK